jgi:hypothetical protein
LIFLWSTICSLISSLISFPPPHINADMINHMAFCSLHTRLCSCHGCWLVQTARQNCDYLENQWQLMLHF